jgi:hypothetical protein
MFAIITHSYSLMNHKSYDRMISPRGLFSKTQTTGRDLYSGAPTGRCSMPSCQNKAEVFMTRVPNPMINTCIIVSVCFACKEGLTIIDKENSMKKL